MIYAIRLLRHRGEKRPADELRRPAHHQGHLVVENDIARVISDVDGKVMFWLEPAKIVRHTYEGGILVHGMEPSDVPGKFWPQAWWCTIPEPVPALEPGQITGVPRI